MIHIFQALDGTTYMAEVCDLTKTDSPINLSIYDTDNRVTLEVGMPGWCMMGLIFEMLYLNDDDDLDKHEPIVDLVASVHWAAMAEPDAMGAI